MQIKYRICIAKAPGRQKPVADIFFEETQWAEINQEGSELQVKFFPGPDGQPWHLSQAAAENALQDASERLTAGTKTCRTNFSPKGFPNAAEPAAIKMKQDDPDEQHKHATQKKTMNHR